MRNLFIFILLLGTTIGQGQTVVDTNYPGKSWNSMREYSKFIMSKTYDTIPCIMLCIDTSTAEVLTSYNYIADTMRYVTRSVSEQPFSFWLKGYEVRLIRDIIYEDNQVPVKHIAWLDEHKKPLSKKRIVWMSKDR